MDEKELIQKQPEKDSCCLATYTVLEISQILKISRRAAYNLCDTGLFKIIRVGKSIRIVKISFDEWFKAAAEQ